MFFTLAIQDCSSSVVTMQVLCQLVYALGDEVAIGPMAFSDVFPVL